MPVKDPKKSNILNVETIEKGIDVETVKPCVKIFKEYIDEHKLKDTRCETRIKKDNVGKDNDKQELMKCKECKYETKRKLP